MLRKGLLGLTRLQRQRTLGQETTQPFLSSSLAVFLVRTSPCGLSSARSLFFSSGSNGVVRGVFLQRLGRGQARVHHDPPRFSVCRRDRRNPTSVYAPVCVSITADVASVRLFANKVLLSPSSHSSLVDSSVEWAYAFDVHTNAFFPLYLTLYIAQLILLPIVTKDKWVCLFVGNTLYLAGYGFSASCLRP